VDRGQPVRRQQALERTDSHVARRARRFAQHQIADCRVLLLGGRHHPATAGAGLDWILDLYDDVDEIVAGGQTIIYSLHPSIGHLGIFVSGKVAAKEHNEFVSCMER
jgi:Protein of unknown function (DUF3141)